MHGPPDACLPDASCLSSTGRDDRLHSFVGPHMYMRRGVRRVCASTPILSLSRSPSFARPMCSALDHTSTQYDPHPSSSPPPPSLPWPNRLPHAHAVSHPGTRCNSGVGCRHEVCGHTAGVTVRSASSPSRCCYLQPKSCTSLTSHTGTNSLCSLSTSI